METERIRRRARFNTDLMFADMVLLGLNRSQLAKRAGVADQTVLRFLRGDVQTPKAAKQIARALGHDVARYLLRVERVA